MITDLPQQAMEQMVQDRRCGECGGRLSKAWGGAFGVNADILRCGKDITHSTTRPLSRSRKLLDPDKGYVEMDVVTQKEVPGNQTSNTGGNTLVTTQEIARQSNAISQQVWELVEDDATYTLKFGGRTPREITALSAVGAQELYNQCAIRGLVPIFNAEKVVDHVIADIWITDVTWRATDPKSGNTWLFSTRGAEPYAGPASDPLAVANRKAMGKAQRNANIRCVPLPIRKAFLAHLKAMTGKEVQEGEEEHQYAPPETARPTQVQRRPSPKPTPKPAPEKPYCDLHQKFMGLLPGGDNRYGHPDPDFDSPDGWCLGQEEATLAKTSSEGTEAPSMNPQEEALRKAVADAGITWEEFEGEALRMPLLDYQVMGGSYAQAHAKLKSYVKQ